MEKPPDRRKPQILFTGPSHQWLGRLNQTHKQFVDLELTTEQQESLDNWVETEFAHSALALEGLQLRRDELEGLADHRPIENEPPESSAFNSLILSLRTITKLARSGGPNAELTPNLLLELHSRRGIKPGFRTSAGKPRMTKPIPAESLPAVIEAALQWYTADSFCELHPIEQASIVFLRLLQIEPFDEGNESTALLAASLFTLRRGLPPIIIRTEQQSAFQAAIAEGFQMNTAPLVELIADAASRTLTGMISNLARRK